MDNASDNKTEHIDGHTHVMPDSGPTHYENKDCWCEPQLDYRDAENNKDVWVHKDTRMAAVN